MQTHTIQLHRVLRAEPALVYKAFLDADALARWLPPDGFLCRVHALDARVGGKFRMTFVTFATGHAHSFGGEYRELTPYSRIRYTDVFDDPNLPGEILVTIDLKPVSCGTEIYIEQSGVPAVIPAEMCYLGWQDSLKHLAQLVEVVVGK
jgi:uncharacterized protein YndB with AHSA1/START domain